MPIDKRSRGVTINLNCFEDTGSEISAHELVHYTYDLVGSMLISRVLPQNEIDINCLVKACLYKF